MNQLTIQEEVIRWLYSIDKSDSDWFVQSGRLHPVTKQMVPRGLSWRWRSSQLIDGFLYGEVDTSGRLSKEKHNRQSHMPTQKYF